MDNHAANRLYGDDQDDIPGGEILHAGSSLKKGEYLLNLDRNYLPHWTTRDAFREFVQNWKDAILETFHLKPANFWVTIEKSDSDYLAKAYDIRNKEKLLGFVSYSCSTGSVNLINFKAQLTLQDLKMGKSSKRGNSNFAGTHGEGFKVAALVMSEREYRVSYTASKFYWNFLYKNRDKDNLICALNPIKESVVQSDMAKEQQRVDNGISRSTTANSWEDVTVGIGHIRNVGRKVEFTEFKEWLKASLDLDPPPKTIDTTSGSLILDSAYEGRVYLMGLLLGIHPASSKDSMESQLEASDKVPVKQFKFGYNLLQGNVNRDRRGLDDGTESQWFSKIWSKAIMVNSADTCKLFVEMLQEPKLCEDVCYVEKFIANSKPSAEKIWQYLQREHSGRNVFFHDQKNVERDTHIVRESLRREPRELPSVIWNPLSKFEIIRSPQQQQRRLLEKAPELYPEDTAYSRSIKQFLNAALALDPKTKDIKICYKSGERADIDLLLDNSTLHIHERCLDFNAWHARSPCRASYCALTNSKDYNTEIFSCDHVIVYLYGRLLDQLMPGVSFGGNTASDGHLRTKVEESLSEVPRKVEIAQGTQSGEIRVSWVDTASERARNCYGLDLKCRVTLHVENDTCRGEKNVFVALNSAAADTESLSNTESQHKAKCGCPQRIVPQKDCEASFYGLTLTEKYFPMMASQSPQAFYAVPPTPLQPKQIRDSNISQTKTALPMHEARPARNSPEEAPAHDDTDSQNNDGAQRDKLIIVREKIRTLVRDLEASKQHRSLPTHLGASNLSPNGKWREVYSPGTELVTTNLPQQSSQSGIQQLQVTVEPSHKEIMVLQKRLESTKENYEVAQSEKDKLQLRLWSGDDKPQKAEKSPENNDSQTPILVEGEDPASQARRLEDAEKELKELRAQKLAQDAQLLKLENENRDLQAELEARVDEYDKLEKAYLSCHGDLKKAHGGFDETLSFIDNILGVHREG